MTERSLSPLRQERELKDLHAAARAVAGFKAMTNICSAKC